MQGGDNVTNFQTRLKNIKTRLSAEAAAHDRNKINELSPYSPKINQYIKSIDELNLYVSLGLQETYITRPTLIIEIDPMYRSCPDGLINVERMLNGDSPIDKRTGTPIHLHHLTKECDAPFVELPQNIHNSTEFNDRLHGNVNTYSWRNDKNKAISYAREKREYWKERGKYYDYY